MYSLHNIVAMYIIVIVFLPLETAWSVLESFTAQVLLVIDRRFVASAPCRPDTPSSACRVSCSLPNIAH
jgi:hypothetical protein